MISTNPPANTQRAKGSAVQLVVSTGKPQVAIPYLVGDTPDPGRPSPGRPRAEGDQANEPSASVPAGEVTRTNPPSGSQVPIGSHVTVFVSTGHTPGHRPQPERTDRGRRQRGPASRRPDRELHDHPGDQQRPERPGAKPEPGRQQPPSTRARPSTWWSGPTRRRRPPPPRPPRPPRRRRPPPPPSPRPRPRPAGWPGRGRADRRTREGARARQGQSAP